MSKSDNILKLSRSMSVPGWVHEVPKDGGKLCVAGRILKDALNIDEAAEGAIQAAGADPDLSDSGKAKARKKTGKIQSGLLDKLEIETFAVVSKAIAEARSTAKQEQSPHAAMIAEIRAREIRDLLMQRVGTDSLQLTLAINEADERGDSITLDALLDAPSVSPLAEMIDRTDLKARRDKMVDLSLGKETVALIQAEGDVLDRIKWAKENISKLAGLDADDDGIEKIAHAETG